MNSSRDGILGVGVDLIRVSRIEKAVRREGREFLAEFLSPFEIDRCLRTRYPLAAAAAAFAAKEAVFKALATGRAGKMSWHDVTVSASGGKTPGAPVVELAGETLRVARRMGVRDIDLSFSEPGSWGRAAMAVVILAGKGVT